MIDGFEWWSLHDATLERVELRWHSGEVVLHLRTGVADCPRLQVVGAEARKVECDRQMPWGFSVSINEVRGPVATLDGRAKRIEIEMQSGDAIVLEARDFVVCKDEAG